MNTFIVPNEVKVSELVNKGSLSPSNYKKYDILNPNQHKIEDYLINDTPYQKGIEPGSSAYVPFSSQVFLRNSCINQYQFSVDKTKYIYLNPNYYHNDMVCNYDVLFCTDANIGDCCLYISDGEKVAFSSGIVKLNFKEEKYKYYVLAFMRDNYFKEQLSAKTPKGAIIKHSSDSFLQCLIPDAPASWVYDVIETLVKNIVYSEYIAGENLKISEELIAKEVITKEFSYEIPSIRTLKHQARFDAGIYSNAVFQWRENVRNYKDGYSTLNEFGYSLKRGTNLAKRDFGRSIQTTLYHPGYYVLIYPSDISSSGYIQDTTYLGTRKPVVLIDKGDILFSTEGTVGKTFAICDDSMKFTTNFHGTIISPQNKPDIKKSIFLTLYLNYLCSSDIFEQLSVGGNGGSFAIKYWRDNIIIPNVNDEFMDQLAILYDNPKNLNPFIFDANQIKEAGIYQINKFLVSCKAVLTSLCEDIKNNELKDQIYYEQLLN